MSDYERGEIRKALLKYCELDTMAMVMIYEGWKDLLHMNNKTEGTKNCIQLNRNNSQYRKH